MYYKVPKRFNCPLLQIAFLILFLLISPVFLIAQSEYALSRQDSALLDKNQNLYRENLALNNKKEASRYLNEIAQIYWEHNHFKKTIENFSLSMQLNKELGNENGIAMLNNNLAMVYSDLGNFDVSLKYFQETLIARRAKDEIVGTISALHNMSVVLNNLKRFDQSIEALEEATDLAREIGNTELQRSCYGMLAETYEKAGNVEQSLYYFEYYKSFHEMIQKETVKKVNKDLNEERLKNLLIETQKRNQELELYAKERELHKQEELIEEYDSTNLTLLESLNKKQMYITILQQENQIKELSAERVALEAKKRQWILWIIVFAAFWLLVVLAVLYRAYRQKRTDNKVLANKNQEISTKQEIIIAQKTELEVAFSMIEAHNSSMISSINYARLIQSSMLTREPQLGALLPNSFVLNMPRDIVSGDFYWYAAKENKIIIAAIDCTGHGVPGALMSMVGNNLLNQIVLNQHITSPELILEEMNLGIIKVLNQESTGNQDGMDAAICVIDTGNKKVQFAGANNPLIYIQNNELKTIKGSKSGIGGISNKKTDSQYELHEIELNSGNNYFYIFSDGFVDQIGGASNRKFMINRFREFILNNHATGLPEQETTFRIEIEKWMYKKSQIDDILVIGFNIEN
ncbi:MAG TPA: hypothetical protein DCQ31_12565 [Bacteroidales bacterium]|nr:hypothetical protein [Bacteroidales bacterium]